MAFNPFQPPTLLDMFAWIFEDKFKMQSAKDYLTKTINPNLELVYQFFLKLLKESDSFAQKACVRKDESDEEKMMLALSSLDVHFNSCVFGKNTEATLVGPEVGKKSPSPIPSIQVTGT